MGDKIIYTLRLDALLLLGVRAGSRSTSDAGWEITLKIQSDALVSKWDGLGGQRTATFTVSMAVPKYEPPTLVAS